MNNAALAFTAVIAIVLFIIFYWQKIWPKTQCWLMVFIGFGVGGLAGNWLNQAVNITSNLSSKATAAIFGIGVPALVAVAALVIFVIFMLPNSKVRTGDVTWLTRISALLVPLSIGMVPVIWANFQTVLAGVA